MTFTMLEPAPDPSTETDMEFVRVTTWMRFRRHRLAIVGAAVLLALVLGAVFAPFLAPFSPTAIDNAHWHGPPLPPCFVDSVQCAHHLLGTDEVGRDLLSRLLFGARISLTVGLVTVLIEVLIGAFIGAIAGYFGGWVDYVLMRLVDVFLSIPLLPLLLVLTGIVAMSSSRASLNFFSIVLIIGALSWPSVARLVRGAFLSLREREFAEAARAVGNGDLRIIFRHLMPNTVAPVIVQATLDIAGVIITESTLSFLGSGIQPPDASWGNMLANAVANLEQAWWIAVFPGLCIFVTVLAINYMGDGLRDALDPNMK